MGATSFRVKRRKRNAGQNCRQWVAPGTHPIDGNFIYSIRYLPYLKKSDLLGKLCERNLIVGHKAPYSDRGTTLIARSVRLYIEADA